MKTTHELATATATPFRITRAQRISRKPSARRRILGAGIAAALAGAGLWTPEAGAADFHWLGQTSSLWNAVNWASDAAGTPAVGGPAAADNVFFSATGAANQNTTLGDPFTITSLTVNDPLPVTIGGASTLTISSAVSQAITVAAGAGLVTITAPLTFAGSANTITVNNTAGLVIDGTFTRGLGLFKEGTGKLTLTNLAASPNGAVVNGGTLQLGNAAAPVSITGNAGVGVALGAGGNGGLAFYVDNGATLDVMAQAAVTGGAGGASGNGDGGKGAAGVRFNLGGNLVNEGTILGGVGGGTPNGPAGAGGAAVSMNGGASFTNRGTATGAAGGFSGNGPGGAGGDGAFATGGGTVTNDGAISGGAGGGTANGFGGEGGAGVRFTGGGTLINRNTITAGAGGGAANGLGGDGGAGVRLAAGGTVDNSGVISGGAAGGGTLQGSSGVGIQATGAAATVNNLSGGVINGGVSMGNFANSVLLETGSTINGALNLGATTTTTLTLGGTGSQLFSAAVTGATIFTGQLIKDGPGTWTLDQAFGHVGGTTINAGTLAIAQNNALGTGNLTMTGGTLRTSGGPRILNIGDGAINFTGGTYVANVGGLVPGVSHDQIVTIGIANIVGATIQLVQQNGFVLQQGQQVVLIQANGGVTGGTAAGTPLAAATVTGGAALSPNLLLAATVNLYPTAVILELVQQNFTQTLERLAQLPNLVNPTPNQFAVAAALDSVLLANGSSPFAVTELAFLVGQTPQAFADSLDRIAPEELTAIFHLARTLANVQTLNIQHRLGEIRAELDQIRSINSVLVTVGGSQRVGKQAPPAELERWGLWMAGSGEFTNVGSTANASGFDLQSGGVTAGIDYRFTENFVAGISLGYMNTNGDLANGGNVHVDGGRIGGYATWYDGGFYVDASISGGPNSYRTRRATPNNTVATGSPEGSELNLMIGTGYDWKKGGFSFGPFANLQYTNVQLDSFTEIGGFAPLAVAEENSESLRSIVGFRASYDFQVGGALVRPEVRAAWQHEYGDTSYSLSSSFAALGGRAFSVFGPETGRDSLLLRAGVSVLWSDRFSTYAFYDGELFRQNFTSHNVSVGCCFKF